MKVPCSQEVVRPHRRKLSHVRSLERRLYLKHRGMCLGSCLHKGYQVEMTGSKAIDFYVFSWDIPRKPACNVVEAAQRKSHPLEGSCQEAIPLPYPILTFFPLGSRRHTPPPIGHLRRIRVFISVASAAMRRTSHPSGSRPRDVSLLRQTSAPGIVDAPENPRFPTVSNRVQRTDSMAPSRVHL
jgi:hypothetical protein